MPDNNLNDLSPSLRNLATMFLENCQSAGLTVRITVTWRDPATQNECKAQGLSNAAAGQSPHNCVDSAGSPASRAFDFALFNDGAYIQDGTDQRYAQAGEIAESLGLAWGGRWHHPDYDHVEETDWRSLQA